MDNAYNHIQYFLPENSEVFFSILPETRVVSVKLLDGIADIYVKDKRMRLHLQQEFSIQFWECLCPRLKTITGCNFLVRGNHYVSSAVQHGLVESTLFAVSPSENSYSFVLEKDIHLQIFPIQSTKGEPLITIRSTRGTPEISGFKLPRKKTYQLSPYSPVLVKSSDEKPYSVYVQGLDRKVKLSILDENHHKCVNRVKDLIFTKKFKHTIPTVLVLGPKNVGKTSFCQLIVNETLEKKMTPVYVDLNIKRNLSVPGSLSLSEIDSRIDSTLHFKYNIQRLLHYGSVVFHSVSIRFYHYLIRKMGGLLSFHLNYNSKTNSLSIIDTDGSQAENDATLELLLKSFAVDLVVYIGDEHDYENLKNSILENMPSEFIPKPRNIEEPSDSYEAKYYQNRIKEYFFGSTGNPSSRNVRIVALRHITIFRISQSNVSVTDVVLHNAYDCKIERIEINRHMTNRLFAVSAAKRVELHGLAEVKYYVYFTAIDMDANLATVMVPKSENFNGGILLMGFILKLDDDEII